MDKFCKQPPFGNPGATIFPKIEGKTNTLRATMGKLNEKHKLPAVVTMEGTVKLHGLHADIIFDLSDLSASQHGKHAPIWTDSMGNDEAGNDSPGLKGVTFQSRNRVCAPTDDLIGWPRQISRQPAALTYLRGRILARFHEVNPNTKLLCEKPMIIAGEWIGRGVQKSVGINKLERGFVILSININGMWQRDSDYAMIEANRASIYSIYNAPPYEVQFDTSDLSDMNPAFFEMQRLADEVEAACPFAARFGFPDMPGEGIVWKLGTREGRLNPRCWIKTKGPAFGESSSRLSKRNAEMKVDRDMTLGKLADFWITDRRVEQGFEYLLEMGIADIKDGQKMFCEWVTADILNEEKAKIERLRLAGGLDVTRKLKSKVSQRAHAIYYEKMKNPD